MIIPGILPAEVTRILHQLFDVYNHVFPIIQITLPLQDLISKTKHKLLYIKFIILDRFCSGWIIHIKVGP